MSQNSPFTIALAGNPNVGKSTIFNALTKMHQHTGNWPGKTVACASGIFRYRTASCLVVDLPGTYSLRTHSEEEEIAREYIASGQSDLLLVVCDATCLERGLRLLKQIRDLEKACPKHVILCVNLCDEAAKKGIALDFGCLSEKLGIPAIPCTARNRRGLEKLKTKIYEIYQSHESQNPEAGKKLSSEAADSLEKAGCSRSVCCGNDCCETCTECTGYPGCPVFLANSCLNSGPAGCGEPHAESFCMAGECLRTESAAAADERSRSDSSVKGEEPCSDSAAVDSSEGTRSEASAPTAGEPFSISVTEPFCGSCVNSCPAACSRCCPHFGAAPCQPLLSCQSCIADFSPEVLASQAVSYRNPAYLKRQEKIDRIVTGPFTSGFIMIALLMAVFWITITGANYPSSFLWDQFFRLETWMASHLAAIGVPSWFINSMIYGVYRVVAWVVSVMLPPMAIFFPLFTLLEDLGYLPRAAFNMDCAFKKCKACGKQCLTMCLGTAFHRLLIQAADTGC